MNHSARSLLRTTLCLMVTATVLSGCQKARMKTVQRQAPPPQPAVQSPPPSSPPPQQTQVPQNNTPLPSPRPHDPIVEPPKYDDPGPQRLEPARPVLYVNPGPRPEFAPIATERPVPPSKWAAVEWFDTNYRPPSVLDFCAGKSCLPDPCTNCPPENTEVSLDPFIQRQKSLTKLDVLFMVDTSASLYPEYARIASNISSFVRALPTETDLRFAMITGHGPELGAMVDNQVWFGKFWTFPSTSGGEDQPVIPAGHLESDSSDSFTGSFFNEKISMNRLSEWLLTKFKGGVHRDHIPHDKSEAQGEALLANLNHFLKTEFHQNSLMPRSDAALAIIFISDENDVCVDYQDYKTLSQEWMAKGKGPIRPHYATSKTGTDPSGITRDIHEHNAYMSKNICFDGSQRIRYDLVGERLRKLYNTESPDGRPVIVSGILHRTNEEIPASNDKYANDREMGLGYIDLIETFGGKAFPLSSTDSGKKLADIGDLSKFRMSYENIIPLKLNGKRLDVRKYILASTRVEILKADGSNIPIDRRNIKHDVLTHDDQGNPIHVNLIIDRSALEAVVGPGDAVIVYIKKETH
ncbi:MAG: hypothetical protein KDD22_00015 [Bdellovibrionales bacterium]|nr:hypothetical protein [Bdellovibrionales bacterium]